MKERCIVSLIDTGDRVFGGSPVGAPMLANELVQELLDRTPGQHDVRIVLSTGPLLTFSFELSPAVLRRIDKLEVCVNHDTPHVERFKAYETKLAIGRAGEWIELVRRRPKLAAMIDELCTQATHEHDVSVRLTFMVERLAGGFTLEAGSVAALAALGAPLGCFFYNAG